MDPHSTRHGNGAFEGITDKNGTAYPMTSTTLTLQSGERWYVVHSKPHREGAALVRLEAQGFKAFLPRYRKTVRHARQLRTVSAPFFPRYLFVALDLDRDRWRSVRGTFGVSSLVMGEDLPLPVAPGVVEALIAATDGDGHLQLGGELVPGQQVRILAGPFADLVGEFTRSDGGGRVQILLKLLGGCVPVRLPRQAFAVDAA